MKNYFYLILISIVFISCRKDFKFKSKKDQEQVNISCFIRAGDTVRVRLSFLISDDKNYDIFSDEAFITNAEVYLFEDNIFKEKLDYKHINYPNYSISGWYYSHNFIPTEGHNYELKVVVPGYDTLFAQTYIPEKTFIDSIIVNNYINNDFGSKDINISVLFKDDYNETNYYLINSDYIFKSQDPIIEAKINNSFWSQAPNINERNAYFSDRNINGENYALNIDTHIQSEFANKISLYSLSSDAYFFYKTTFLYARTLENPLTEPVVIYSNIKNGTGIFAGMSSDVDSIILIKT